ncbi:MAG: transcriptional regulator NrdR [Candidatus Paceibacteria bacterium]
MKCAQCFSEETRILDSRVSKEGMQVRRRRSCANCEYRFTTTETREPLDLMVVKKSGAHERYSRDKLFAGLNLALQKRPITKERILDLCLNIEAELITKHSKEVDAKTIGSTALRHLKDVDEVGYVRFASVYRDFKTIKGFRREIEKFLSEDEKK